MFVEAARALALKILRDGGADDEARIRHIHHKPGDERYGVLGNAGAYLIEPAALAYLPEEPREEDFFHCRTCLQRQVRRGRR